MKKSVLIVGAGRVGQTLLRILSAAPAKENWDCIGVISSRSPDDSIFKNTRVYTIHDNLPTADILLLTVPDSAIFDSAAQLAKQSWINKQTTTIHFSGATSLQALQPLSEQGAEIGCLHPVYSFSDPKAAAENLAGHFAAIESQSSTTEILLTSLATTLGLTPFPIQSEWKTRYHAALSAASNFTVSIAAYANQLLEPLSLPEDLRHQLVASLMAQTVRNLKHQSPRNALTGPIIRGDASTVSAHLSTLFESEKALYLACAQELVNLTAPLHTPAQQSELQKVLSNQSD